MTLIVGRAKTNSVCLSELILGREFITNNRDGRALTRRGHLGFLTPTLKMHQHHTVAGFLAERSPEKRRVLLQPALGGFEAGADAFDFAPESARVIHLTQVTKLVKNDVVLDLNRGLDEPPIQ